MEKVETIISIGVIVVMQRAGQGPRRNLIRLYSNHEVDPWLKQLKLISPKVVRQ